MRRREPSLGRVKHFLRGDLRVSFADKCMPVLYCTVGSFRAAANELESCICCSGEDSVHSRREYTFIIFLYSVISIVLLALK